jgi:hypothetical protein
LDPKPDTEFIDQFCPRLPVQCLAPCATPRQSRQRICEGCAACNRCPSHTKGDDEGRSSHLKKSGDFPEKSARFFIRTSSILAGKSPVTYIGLNSYKTVLSVTICFRVITGSNFVRSWEIWCFEGSLPPRNSRTHFFLARCDLKRQRWRPRSISFPNAQEYGCKFCKARLEGGRACDPPRGRLSSTGTA